MRLLCLELFVDNPVENEAIMPQNTSLIIKDGQATPLDHTFLPSRIDSNNIATFTERAASGIPVGQPTITWQVRPSATSSATNKISGKLTVPKVVTTTDTSGKTVTSVDYINLATIELVTSTRSTKQERKDLRVLLSNLLLNTAIASTSDDLESFW